MYVNKTQKEAKKKKTNRKFNIMLKNIHTDICSSIGIKHERERKKYYKYTHAQLQLQFPIINTHELVPFIEYFISHTRALAYIHVHMKLHTYVQY